jgi:type I restriction enzyme, S subunit
MSKTTEYKLADIFPVSMSGEWGSDPFDEGNALVLRAADFTKDCKLRDIIGAPRNIPQLKLGNRVLKDGDILIEKSGGSPDQPVGRVAFFDRGEDKEVYVHSNFLQLLRVAEGFDKKFCYYLMAFLYSKGLVFRYQQQTTGIINLKLENYLKEKVSVPSVSVQRQIQEILSTIDRTITHTEALIEKYQQIKAGLMHDLFTRGIGADGKLRPPRDKAPELYQDSSIGWIPKEWSLSNLSEVLAKIDSGWSPACTEVPPGNGEWGVLKVSAVTKGIYDWKESKTLPNNLKPIPSLEVRNGDVIMTRANGVAELVGKCVQVSNTQDRLMLSDKLLRLSPNSKIMTNDYLGLLMCSDLIKNQIDKSMNGSSGQRNISQADIRKFICPVPCKNEQESISNNMLQHQDLIQRERTFVEKLTQQKSGLMHDLLTGTVQVNSDPV